MNALDQWIENIYIREGVFPPSPKLNFQELKETEWNSEFERYQRNRLIMGAFRHGIMKDKADGTIRYAYPKDIERRLKLYKETKNLEVLVDITNLCMLEFTQMRGEYSFESIDDGEHCQRI